MQGMTRNTEKATIQVNFAEELETLKILEELGARLGDPISPKPFIHARQYMFK